MRDMRAPMYSAMFAFAVRARTAMWSGGRVNEVCERDGVWEDLKEGKGEKRGEVDVSGVV